MAVEILILSGARQGEQLLLEGREFTAGSNPNCEIFFDVQRDPAVHGRSASFRLRDDGWYVRCAGGEVLVNQHPVTGSARVRSGDVVRMSPSGPDFLFSIVTAAAASQARSSAPVLEVSGGPIPQPLVEIASPVETPPAERRIPEIQQADALQAAGHEHRFPRVPMPRASADRQWAVWAIGGLALGVLALIVLRSTFAPPTVVVNVGQSGTLPGPAVAAVREGPRADQGNAFETKESAGGQKNQTKITQEKGQAADLCARLKDAVFLLQVENAGRMWPFATCVAIGNDTLLTTAREASQLARWRADQGFKIWVTRQAAGFKEEVQEIRVSGMFASLADKPNDWIYFDLGLLTVRGTLPTVASLASPEELAGVEEGMPVACFGFPHEGEKTTRFDHFEPHLSRGKVYVITVSPDLPGRPKLLHVKAEIPKNAYGSPVVDAEGRVLGVYGEAAGLPPGKGKEAASAGAELKNMHYVVVADPMLLRLWLQNRDAKMWPAAAGR